MHIFHLELLYFEILIPRFEVTNVSNKVSGTEGAITTIVTTPQNKFTFFFIFFHKHIYKQNVQYALSLECCLT